MKLKNKSVPFLASLSVDGLEKFAVGFKVASLEISGFSDLGFNTTIEIDPQIKFWGREWFPKAKISGSFDFKNTLLYQNNKILKCGSVCKMREFGL